MYPDPAFLQLLITGINKMFGRCASTIMGTVEACDCLRGKLLKNLLKTFWLPLCYPMGRATHQPVYVNRDQENGRSSELPIDMSLLRDSRDGQHATVTGGMIYTPVGTGFCN